MKGSLLEKLGSAVAFPVERGGVDPARSTYERFAIPYSFKPRLSLAEAVIAATGAFFRIFLGSILFAVWGVYTFLAVHAVPGFLWRGVVLLALIALLAILMVILGSRALMNSARASTGPKLPRWALRC